MYGAQRILLDKLAAAAPAAVATVPRERLTVLVLVRKRLAVIVSGGVRITELGLAEHARVLGPRKNASPRDELPRVPATQRGVCCGRSREITDSGILYCKSCGRTVARRAG